MTDSRRVLVVEECTIVRELVVMLLQYEGYDVHSASTLREGRLAFRREHFDSVLCDDNALREEVQSIDLEAHRLRTRPCLTPTVLPIRSTSAQPSVHSPIDATEIRRCVRRALIP